MKQVESFAKRLRELIEERDMTYEALSKATGINPQTLNRWALGQRTPKVTAINPVAESFGVNPLWLFGYDVPKEPPVYVDGSATLTSSVSLSDRGEVIGPKSIPILGTIAAGIPLYCEQSVEGYIAVPPHWQVNYALRVKGESMIGASIPDGSLVLCKAQQDVDNGQIAVCIVDGEEATLKRVRRYGDVLVLQPENPAFEERTFAGENKDQVTIQGLAIKVIKDVM